MKVCGNYENRFTKATHCVFHGHLDDPAFRAIAIQRIIGRTDKTVVLNQSGELPVKRRNGREYVKLEYQGFFGREQTTGSPFKDEKTLY